MEDQHALEIHKFYCDADMVVMYKSQVLSYIEYKTPGIYHACANVLDSVDSIQRKFLSDICISLCDSLMSFKLAPLKVRRDIAMMGVIHRAALGKGPSQLQDLFPPAVSVGRRSARIAAKRHTKERAVTIEDHQRCMVERSAFGLVRVYNLLPQQFVDTDSVSLFQSGLQHLVRTRATGGCADWQSTLSPRVQIEVHPLRRL